MEDVKSDGMYPSLRGWLYMFRMTRASSCAKSLSNLLGMLGTTAFAILIDDRDQNTSSLETKKFMWHQALGRITGQRFKMVCKTYKKVINLIGNWSLTGIWLLSSTIRYAICRLCAYMTYSVRGKRVTVKSPVLEM